MLLSFLALTLVLLHDEFVKPVEDTRERIVLKQRFFIGSSQIGDGNIFECTGTSAKHASWRVEINGYEIELTLNKLLCIRSSQVNWYEYGVNSSGSWIILHNITRHLNKSIWKCSVDEDVGRSELFIHSYPDVESIYSEVTFGSFISRHNLMITTKEYASIQVVIGCAFPYPMISVFLKAVKVESIVWLSRRNASTGSGFRCNNPFDEKQSSTDIKLERRMVSSIKNVIGRLHLMIEIGMQKFFVRTKTIIHFKDDITELSPFRRVIENIMHKLSSIFRRLSFLQASSKCVAHIPASANVSIDNITWSERPVNDSVTLWEPSLKFLCDFTPMNDEALYYSIEWFIDDMLEIVNETVQESSKDKAVIFLTNFTAKAKKIQCRVGVKREASNKACNFTLSPPFYVELKDGLNDRCIQYTQTYPNDSCKMRDVFVNTTTLPEDADELPDSTNQTIVDVTICKVGSSICEKQHSIRVKNCAGFVAYEPSPLDACPSAYCFDISQNCVNDVPTNIEVVLHNITWTNSTESGLIFARPELKWKCNFAPLSNSSYFYEISWFFNSTLIANQTVTNSNLDDAVVSTTDINDNKMKFNSEMQCIVGAKISADSPACKKNSSAYFFMGVKNKTPILTLKRGTTGIIKFRSTVPFVDQYIVAPPNPIIPIPSPANEVKISLSRTSDISTACDIPITDRKCEVKIPVLSYPGENEIRTSSWDEEYELPITTLASELYSIEASWTARLIVDGIHAPTLANIYNNIFLSDTIVHVVDDTESWGQKSCTSVTDPHMKSFDGVCYECQLPGVFILYRNEYRNQEVQVKHHRCSDLYSYPYCNCAVAVRAGRAIFVADICSGIGERESFIDFTLCDDKVLDVVMVNEKQYKVYMPSGTFVSINMRTWPNDYTWQIDVTINPSLSDMHNTSGLCGIMDDDPTNDFSKPDGDKLAVVRGCNYYLNIPNEFSESWSIPEDTSLFANSKNVYHNFTSISETNIEVCKCDSGRTVCNAKSSPRCTNTNRASIPCRINDNSYVLRKKRSAGVITKNEQSHKISKKQTTVIDVNEAENICNSAFEQSPTYTMCIENVASLSNSSYVNCVMDIMTTGDINITKIHIQAAIEQCSTFVTLNTTLQKENPAILVEIENYCPNNCSDNGICSMGNCTCNFPFAGSDCSFDQSQPPTITYVSDFGKCDKSKEVCTTATVNGRYFYLNSNASCHVQREEVNINGNLTSTVTYEKELQIRTLFQAECEFSYNNLDAWLISFSFKITNDGKTFTDVFTTYIHNSDCQEFHNNSGNVYYTLREGNCYISGTCIENGNLTSDGCSVCNTSSNLYEWTPFPGCNSSSASSQINMYSSPYFSSSTNLISSTENTSQIHSTLSNKSRPKKEDDIPIIAVAVPCAIVIVAIIAGILVKKLLITSNERGQSSPRNIPNVDGAQHDNVLPENTSPEPELLFENVEQDCISRPPTATSQYSEGVRLVSATNDFRHLLDNMFTASNYKLQD